MDDNQAGKSSPSPQQNKMPWEAEFWGAVGDTIKEVKTGLVGASKAPAKAPWEDGFWGVTHSSLGVTHNVEQKIAPKSLFKNEASLKVAAAIPPNEMLPDTRSAVSNIAEIDDEIKKARSPQQIAILKEERAKWERKMR